GAYGAVSPYRSTSQKAHPYNPTGPALAANIFSVNQNSDEVFIYDSSNWEASGDLLTNVDEGHQFELPLENEDDLRAELRMQIKKFELA
ncbi:hypothetical protein, partial [Escherichia coli]|uniref:hypothetical protein n=1 Tax=Escherichia coli TaxID=562 RepID=UPI0013B366B2